MSSEGQLFKLKVEKGCIFSGKLKTSVEGREKCHYLPQRDSNPKTLLGNAIIGGNHNRNQDLFVDWYPIKFNVIILMLPHYHFEISKIR